MPSTMPNATTVRPRLAKRLLCRLLAASVILQPYGAYAAAPPPPLVPVPISNLPVGLASGSVVKPNFMFILDDSGSMNSEFMPGNRGEYDNRAVGLYSATCNTIYYDPSVTYEAPPHPLDPLNLKLPTPNPSAMPSNGFGANGYNSNPPGLVSYVDINSFLLDDASPSNGTAVPTNPLITPSPAFSYKWNGGIGPTEAECKALMGAATPPSTVGLNWTKIDVPVGQKQNFAIWYSYYRTRLLAMKSSAGRAFAGLDDGLRAGFITINPSAPGTDPVLPSKHLAIDDFNATQKKNWLKTLYEVRADGETPLKTALSRVGRHYAGKTDSINTGMQDPVQYSCQRNYAFLTTDGYHTDWSGLKIDTSGIENEDSSSSLPNEIRDDFAVDLRVTAYTQNGWPHVATTPNPLLDPALQACATSKGVSLAYLSAPCNDFLNVGVYEEKNFSGGAVEYQPKGYPGVGWRGIDPGDITGPILGMPAPVTTSTGSPNQCILHTTTTDVYDGADGPVTNCYPSNAPPWTTVYAAPVSSSATLNSKRTLADTALYYYQTNLRDAGSGGNPTNATSRNVEGPVQTPPDLAAARASLTDIAKHPRMMTYTLGFGVPGWLGFDPNYETQASISTPNDYFDLKSRNLGKGWLHPYWSGVPATIDDLWHAAVNGRGRYASAKSADDVLDTIEATLADITGTAAGGAAVGVSNVEPTSTNNFIYSPSYVFGKWRGDLTRRPIDTATGITAGTLGAVTVKAADLLGARAASDTRDIKLMNGSAALVDFKWGSMTDAQKALFKTAAVFPTLRARNGTAPANEDLVNHLRGLSDTERCSGPSAATGFFRCRDVNSAGKKLVLGDIVNSQPLHVSAPEFKYADPDYLSVFAAAGSPANTRPATVYVGANDGMLHAFDATTLEERWAIIPSAMWPKSASEPGFARIASRGYGTNHRFSVDGTPVGGDIWNGSAWRTIVVGGYNAGGRGYYAVDVTDPNTPQPRWEFNEDAIAANADDLGLSFGNPIIVKRAGDGKWVVLVTSGYNSPNGRGVLFVLDAVTGAVLQKIDTGVGAPNDQAGLAKISAWADDAIVNNTSRYVYGGDLKGNLWRFDITPGAATPFLKLAELKDASSVAQPITSAPELSRVPGSTTKRMVFISTGRLLHDSDLSSTQTQSVYAIVDDNTAITLPDLRVSFLSACTITNVVTLVGTDRNTSCPGSPTNGWYMDLLSGSERIIFLPRLQLGALVFATGAPPADLCQGTGETFLHYVDYRTGKALPGTPSARSGHKTGGLAGGFMLVRLPDGTMRAIVSGVDGSVTEHTVFGNAAVGGGKRVSWREVAE